MFCTEDLVKTADLQLYIRSFILKGLLTIQGILTKGSSDDKEADIRAGIGRKEIDEARVVSQKTRDGVVKRWRAVQCESSGIYCCIRCQLLSQALTLKFEECLERKGYKVIEMNIFYKSLSNYVNPTRFDSIGALLVNLPTANESPTEPE